MRRHLLITPAFFLAACLDNAGPEDFPPQLIRVIEAPEGPELPGDSLDAPIAVRVTDLRGNPSAGIAVSWTASHGGTLLPRAAVTNGEGVARADWVLGLPPGAQTATATVTGSDVSAAILVEARGWQVKAIFSSRGFHLCALDLADAAYCWGSNSHGQLGDGSLTASADPRRVATQLRFSSLAGGQQHTCGLSAGRVYCWGANYAGQLGDGTTVDRAAPTEALLPLGTFTSVAAGEASTCALTAAGEGWCWGSNQVGSLGRNWISDFEATPAPIAGGGPWRSLATSGWASCGIAMDRGVFCWGEGDNGGPPVLAPARVQELPAADAVAVSSHAKCALAGGTALYCWGSFSGLMTPSLWFNGMLSMSAAARPFFGLGMDGSAYHWGGFTNSTVFWGYTPRALFDGPPLGAVAGSASSGPCGLELETSTLYCWTGNVLFVGESERAYAMRPPEE